MLVAYILAFSPFNPPPLLSLPLSLVKGIKKLCPLCCLLSTLGLCVCVCVCSSSSSSKSSSPHCCLSSNLFFSVSLLFCACLGAEEEGECLGHRYQVPPAPDLCAAGRRAGGVMSWTSLLHLMKSLFSLNTSDWGKKLKMGRCQTELFSAVQQINANNR